MIKIKKRIVYIVGTRPEIIRSANIIKLLKSDHSIDFKLVHTGQHYDQLMSADFFKEFGIPFPDVNLGVGSSSHTTQTAEIMQKMEKFCLEYKPDLVAVFGDTNSSLAASLAAVKLKIPVAHLEAGGREFEMDIPEEINRIVIDHISNLLLPVSDVCRKNLEKENVIGKIFNTGDPLFEVFQKEIVESKKLKLVKKYRLKKEQYVVITLHRDKNVDDIKKLMVIFQVLISFKNIKFIFPVHPRTKKQLNKLNYLSDVLQNFTFLPPVNYKEILNLISNSKFVITDSGGLQKEAFWCRKPCLILRNNTSWTELVDEGVNFLCEIKAKLIRSKIYYILNSYDELIKKYSKIKNPYYKKDISKKNVSLLKQFAGRGW